MKSPSDPPVHPAHGGTPHTPPPRLVDAPGFAAESDDGPPIFPIRGIVRADQVEADDWVHDQGADSDAGFRVTGTWPSSTTRVLIAGVRPGAGAVSLELPRKQELEVTRLVDENLER